MGMIGLILAAAGTITIAVASRLLADEVKVWLPRATSYAFRMAVRSLTEGLRERYAEEWEANIDDTPGDIGKLLMAISLIFASRRMAWDARRHIMPAFTVKALDFMANYGSRRILRLEMWKLHRQLVPMLGRRLSDELVGAVHLSLQEPVRAIVRQGLIARTEPKIVAAALLDAITIMAPRAAVAFATGLDEPDRAALLGLSDAQKKARTNPGPADWSKMRLRIARAIFDKYLF